MPSDSASALASTRPPLPNWRPTVITNGGCCPWDGSMDSSFFIDVLLFSCFVKENDGGEVVRIAVEPCSRCECAFRVALALTFGVKEEIEIVDLA